MSVTLFDWQLEVFLETQSKFNVIPSGRRTGKTQGAVIASIITAGQGNHNLWVDTIYSNIDRYFERYYYPILNENEIDYKWNVQKKILKIGDGYIDFRSADRPESIEGFGYHNIYLNEAGIILNNDYLYTNAILPMLMDFEGSKLFAFGTPKGKRNKYGEKHRFYKLWKNVVEKQDGYSGKQLSSYDNPILTEENIKELEEEIRKFNPDAVRQEVYGEYIDAKSEALYNFNELNKFELSEFNEELTEHTLGHIDVATSGTDNLCSIIIKIIEKKIYLVDVVFSGEDTSYTTPLVTEQIKKTKPEYVWIEKNGAGELYAREIQTQVNCTVIPYHQSANKHAKIISNAPFIKREFYFRTDYETGSHYDLFIKNLFAYNKDKKENKNIHDDAPDSIASLSDFTQKYLVGNWD